MRSAADRATVAPRADDGGGRTERAARRGAGVARGAPCAERRRARRARDSSPRTGRSPGGSARTRPTSSSIDEELRAAGVRRPDQPDRHRLGGPDAPRRRHRGTAASLAARHPVGRGVLVPAVQRARRRQRPRVAAHAAVRDGDEWVVTGQKIWTSYAHVATYGILLARTDPDAEAHQGISYFVCPMRAEGVDDPPARRHDRRPRLQRGLLRRGAAPGGPPRRRGATDGWRLAKVTLGNERVSLSGRGRAVGEGADRRGPRRAREGPRARPPCSATRSCACGRRARCSRCSATRLVAAALEGRAARSGGLGAQGARRRPRPARHGAREGPRRDAGHARGHRAARTGSARGAPSGTTASSTPRRSRSAAAPRRCSATSSPSACSDCPKDAARPEPLAQRPVAETRAVGPVAVPRRSSR